MTYILGILVFLVLLGVCWMGFTMTSRQGRIQAAAVREREAGTIPPRSNPAPSQPSAHNQASSQPAQQTAHPAPGSGNSQSAQAGEA